MKVRAGSQHRLLLVQHSGDRGLRPGDAAPPGAGVQPCSIRQKAAADCSSTRRDDYTMAGGELGGELEESWAFLCLERSAVAMVVLSSTQMRAGGSFRKVQLVV